MCCVLSFFFHSYKAFGAQDLLDFVTASLKNNLSIRSEKYAVAASKSAVKSEEGRYKPRIDFELLGSQTKNWEPEREPINALDFSVSVVQALYDPSISAGSNFAEAKSVEAKMAKNLAEQKLILQTTNHYISYIERTEKVADIRGQMSFIKEHIKIVREKRKLWSLNNVDVQMAEARQSKMNYDLIDAKSELQQLKLLLESISGLRPQAPLRRLSIKLQDIHLKFAPEISTNHPEALVLNSQVQSEYAVQKLARSKFYPKLDSFASIESNRRSEGRKWYSFGIRLTYNLYEGGQSTARLQEVAHTLSAKKFNYQKYINEVSHKLKKSIITYHSSGDKIKILKQSIEMHKQILLSRSQQFKSGSVSIADVLNAQEDLFKVQRQIAKAERNIIQSSIDLLAISGRLNLSELKKVVHLGEVVGEDY